VLEGCEERQLDGLLAHRGGIRLGVAGRDRLQQPVRVRLQPLDLGRRRRPVRTLPRLTRSRMARVPVEEVETRVRRDPVEPRAEGGTALEGPAPAPRPQERLLHQVLRLLERAEHPVAVHPQLPPVALDKLGERRLIARPGCGDECAVLGPRLTH
jgi:hypothetical protein